MEITRPSEIIFIIFPSACYALQQIVQNVLHQSSSSRDRSQYFHSEEDFQDICYFSTDCIVLHGSHKAPAAKIRTQLAVPSVFHSFGTLGCKFEPHAGSNGKILLV